MRTLYLVILLLLCSFFSSGQDIHFFDENGVRITKEIFEKQRLKRDKLGLSFQRGRITETRLFLRSKTGLLNQEIRNTILSNLQRATGRIVSRSDLVIINYHQGKDKCNSSASATSFAELKAAISQYKRQIKRIGRTSEFYLYATKEGIRDSYGIIDWFPDENLLVEKTFFKYKYPYRSFVIIKPDGQYYAYFGEFSGNQKIDQAKLFLK